MSQERPPRQARSPSRPAHSKDTRYSLYVSGLSPKVTEDDLYEHFAKEGKVHRMCRHGSVVNTFETLPFDTFRCHICAPAQRHLYQDQLPEE